MTRTFEDLPKVDDFSRSSHVAILPNRLRQCPKPLPKNLPPKKPIPTHFTSTGPYAGSKPHPRATTIPVTPGPVNETPQQRVARLRKAASIARAQNVNWQDKLVDRGRVWADRAHRTTAWSLIGFTEPLKAPEEVNEVLASDTDAEYLQESLRLYADMLYSTWFVFNRKKKSSWLAEQQVLRQEKLKVALRAMGSGTATEEQILLINQYRSVQEAEEARVKNRGVFGKSVDIMFPSMTTKQQEAKVLSTMQEELFQTGGSIPLTASDFEMAKAIPSESMKPLNEEGSQPAGGPLDRRAEQLSEAAEKSTRSWTSWLTGRSA